MERLNIPSGSIFEDKIGFSKAVRIGNIIAVSGTAPIIEGILEQDVYIQTKICGNGHYLSSADVQRL